MTSNERGNWLKFFASIAPVFESRFVEPLQSRYPHAEEDPWQSLGVFLEGYAFEHQGRDPSFSHAAGDVVGELQSTPLAGVATQEVWKRFREKFPNKSRRAGFNIKNNPLAPKHTRYKAKGRSYETTGLSVIEFAQKSIKVKPLVAWAKNGMHDNQTRAIHERLLDITGVGQKIASLFLRDVAIRDKPTRAPDRYLLQPIDIWVRRCVERLNPNRDFKKNDIAIAKWITNHALEPEAVNQGMWYFANQVVRSEYRLQAALCDLGSARKLLKEHCRSLQRAASVWNRAGRVRP